MPRRPPNLVVRQVFPAADCLCAVYARKHPVPPGATPQVILIVDMGRLQTTVVVARFGQEGTGAVDCEATEMQSATKCPYSVLAVRGDEDLGAFNFDDRMFRHFQGAVSVGVMHALCVVKRSLACACVCSVYPVCAACPACVSTHPLSFFLPRLTRPPSMFFLCHCSTT